MEKLLLSTNKILLTCLCFIFFGLIAQAQIININNAADPQSSFDPQQLIEDILISGECSEVNNFSFQVSGNPTDLMTKSYGYFRTPAGSSFPFAEGVILTTGAAFPAGNTSTGPGNVISNMNGLPGDTDLEAALSIGGTLDATFINFNFTPLIDTIDFRFLMASEEYDGMTECTFADGFAFLLRQVGTANFINLAVLPDGTPINVTNINNSSLINNVGGAPNCDANIPFFGGYDIGETNYGGRTAVLTASATVIPNVEYEIRLIVADQGDSAFDSAIFIEAGSFNVGGDLGDDFTIAAGNPGCDGQPIILDATLSTTGAVYSWFRDGVLLAGETNPTLSVTTDGLYRSEVLIASGCMSTDQVFIEFTAPPVIAAAPQDIVICETDTDLVEVFDFTDNTNLILGGQSAIDFPISFHATQADAQTNQNPLTLPYSNTLQQETIWMRIADATQTCFEVVSFDIEVQTMPIANTPADFALCDDATDGDDTNGETTFDLSTQISNVLGAQSAANFDVTFYLSQAEADLGTAGTDITTPITNTTNPQTIFTRIENNANAGCFATTSFNLNVITLPVVASAPQDIFICETDNDLVEVFDFTNNTNLVLGGQSAANFPISFHATQTDAQTNQNPLALPYSNTLQQETIWMRIADVSQTCFEVVSFDIEVQTMPIANTPADFELCDDATDGDDTNGQTTFDLSTQINNVLGAQSAANFDVTFYLSQAEADLGTAGTDITTPITNTTNPQTIFARIENNANVNCFATTSFNLVVNPLPLIANTPQDILICETDNDLVEVFDFTNNTNLVLGGQSAANFPVSFHATQVDAQTNQNPLALPYSNTLQQETIWVRIADATQTCFNLTSFDIEVQTMPVANTPADFALCDDATDGDDTNGQVVFDLSTRVNEVLGTQSGANFNVTFYLSQAEADLGAAGTNITTPITNTVTPQTVFARIENNANIDCFATTPFNLVVNPLPDVNAIVDLEQCDDDTDGISLFNLTQANTLISTNSVNETFTYYLTQSEADTGLVADQITNVINYPNPTPLNSIVFARIESTEGCVRTSQINLMVGTTQIPASFNLEFEVCDDDLVDGDNTNGVATFDFSSATPQIVNLFPAGQSITVTYYESQADAAAETNPIPDISNHRNTSFPNTQSIYVRVDSDDVNACLGLGRHITLTVNPLPANNTITDSILCSDDGTNASFDLSVKDSEVIGAQTATLLISYHLSLADAQNNVGALVSPFTNTTNPQTIFVRSQFDTNGNGLADADECFNTDMSFQLVVNQNPVISAPDSITMCNDQTSTVYDLTIREAMITAGDTSISLAYFESQLDIDTNNPILDPTNYTSTQLNTDILVVATATNGCESITTLTLETILFANLNLNPTGIEECEVDNDGFDTFDLTRGETDILNGLNRADFTFVYYESQADALAGNTNTISDVTAFTNTVAVSQTIFVRVTPTTNACAQVVPITLIVNPVPEIGIEDQYVLCLSSDENPVPAQEPTFLPTLPIDTQLSSAEFTFQWFRGTDPLAANLIVGETQPTFTPTAVGDYTVLATNILTGCTIPATTSVIGSFPPESISVEVTTPAFSDNATIEVTVEGSGTYEFSIDNIVWQSSPIFTDLPLGQFIVLVRDIQNCDVLASNTVTIIDFPRFFTPNNDGFNDTWNIPEGGAVLNAEVFVFDRFGKLLAQITPDGPGWDGTVGGELLPTNDYWFTIEFDEPKDGVRRQFRSHFTLRR